MQIKDITDRLGTDGRSRIGEVLRFGVVGVLATVLQYAIYWVLLRWAGASLSLAVGYAVSFVFNFVASTRYTFRVKANASRGAGFALSHVVNFLLQMATLNLFIWLGVSRELAPVPMFCVCVPVNFILVRFFLKKEWRKKKS
ncbi:MAG: GtrA family protein [Prevotella sp.]|nr:GtrA family protein [Prevotella sp.]